MALSQDEQRVLAEIERRLAAEDPGLASSLATFRRPSAASVLRSPRARIIGSLFTVLLVAMVSLMVYAMIPFRAHTPRHEPPTSAPATTAMSAVTSTQPGSTRQSSASASTMSATGQSASNRSATAAGKAQQAKVKPTSVAMWPDASP
jgi:cytoskeletal protein RodZ